MKKITLILSAIAFAASCLHAEFELNDSMKQQLMDACPAKAAAKPQKPRKILFFSKTAGFRHHDGIAAERFAYQNMGDKLGIFEVVTSEDTADVEPDKLKQYDAIIMCSTTGKIFGDDSERILKGIMDYVENGGGLMTIHGGVDCYNYDPFRRTDYTSMLGGEFIDHPWNYGERSTMVIDDTQSPITKGIWNGDSFGMTDEIYMLGQTYNRDTCRVLIRLDRDRSPEKPHANPKRDIATVLIKKYGKGRIAYDAFGHGWQVFTRPDMQELAMRLTQFVCGDLEADTTPLPFVDRSAKHANSNAYIKPTPEFLKKLSDLDYGQDRDKEINEAIFGACGWNNNPEFCREMENFIKEELSNGSGTPVYQALLAEMLWAVKISSKANCAAFEKIMKKKGLDEGVRGRISNAVDHFKAKGAVPMKDEKAFQIPSELPKSQRETVILFNYLANNKDVKIPEYLNFEALPENGKAMLIFTLGQRGEDLSKAFSIEPKSFDTTMALAYAAAKTGNADAIPAILKGAQFINGLQDRQIITSYITSIHSDKLLDVLLKSMQNAKGKEAELLVDVLSRLNLDEMVGKIFSGFENMAPAVKISTIRTAESIDTPAVFSIILKLYGAESDKKVKGAMMRALMKSAQSDFSDDMFAQITDMYSKLPDGSSDKVQLLNFAQFASNDDALEFCKNAYKAGLREPAIKAMGKWRNTGSLPSLVAIAKATSDNREKQIAQIEIISIGDRMGWDADTTEYMLKDAIRPEDKEKSLEIAAKSPSQKGVAALRKLGKNDLADKAEKLMKNARPKGFTSDGESNIDAMLDGNIGSRWTSGKGMTEKMFLAFDFGFPKEVSGITIDLGSSGNDFPDKFEVQIGGAVNATSKVDFDWKREGSVVTINFGKVLMANVFKLVNKADKSGSWWSVHEVKFSDSPNVKPLSIRPLNAKFVGSNSPDMSAAFDGDRNSRWASGTAIRSGMTAIFEFSGPKKISKITADLNTSKGDFPDQYEVLAGNTADSAKSVEFTESRSGDTVTISIKNPVAAKFYKIVAKADKNPNWWSIHELSFE